jgi:hypothetical protein
MVQEWILEEAEEGWVVEENFRQREDHGQVRDLVQNRAQKFHESAEINSDPIYQENRYEVHTSLRQRFDACPVPE